MLWNSRLPKKVNILLWKIKIGRIPCRSLLNERGIDLNSILCPWCGEGVENIDHALVNCEEVKKLGFELVDGGVEI